MSSAIRSISKADVKFEKKGQNLFESNTTTTHDSFSVTSIAPVNPMFHL